MRRLSAALSLSAASLLAACGATSTPASDGPEGGIAGVTWALEIGAEDARMVPDDATRLEGEMPVVRFETEVQEPLGLVRALASSDDFDTTLTVISPSGREWYNDDWEGTDSMLQLALDEPGTWAVEVRPYDPAQTGRAWVRWRPLDPDADIPTVIRDGAMESAVTPGGGGFGGSAEERALWLEATAGERVRLCVTSPDFDTTALLLGPDGTRWYNDDGGETGEDGTESTLDSTIEAVIGVTGRYQLIVAPYGEANGGRFAVATRVRPPVLLGPDEDAPSIGFAGPDGEGRMFGLFFGIEHYSESDILPGCADDATSLAATFRDRGLMSRDQQVIWTDAKATRAAFLRGVQSLQEQVGPDDVVIVFFSGHGGVLPVDDEDEVEIDGNDETLVFHDGELRDHEVASALDRLDAGTIVLALDACQAGGFLRDFVDEPGRIGIFSSDEDILSSTAEPVGAGGYLSYAMREAVRGVGDARPSDGAMTAGELTDSVVESFVENHRLMNPGVSIDPLQRVHFDRGSLGWGDLLWVYPRGEDGALIGVSVCEDASTSSYVSAPSTCSEP